MTFFVRVKVYQSHFGYTLTKLHTCRDCPQLTKVSNRSDARKGEVVEIAGEITEKLDQCETCQKQSTGSASAGHRREREARQDA